MDGSADEEGIAHQGELYPQVVGEYDRRVGAVPAVRFTRGFASARDLPAVVEGLSARGFGDEDLKKFLGGNFRRVFSSAWRGLNA